MPRYWRTMKRTMLFGMIFAGLIAVANGCNSTPPPRDYHEYSGIHAGQPGSGDAIGMSMYSTYGRAANGRPTPARPSNLATVPQE
jgi:hypothetical protein